MVCYLCGFCNRNDTKTCARCERFLLEDSGKSLFPNGLGFIATVMAAMALLVAAGSALNSDRGYDWQDRSPLAQSRPELSLPQPDAIPPPASPVVVPEK